MIRKSIVIFLLLLFSFSFLYAAEEGESGDNIKYEPATITFSPEGKVFVGFTTKLVSNLMPVDESIRYGYGEGDKGKGIVKFKYDDVSKSFVSDTFYYYVQAFTVNPLQITLKSNDDQLVLVSTDGSNSRVKYDFVSSTVDELNVEGNIASESYGKDTGNKDDKPSYLQESARLYKGDVRLQVSVEEVKDTSKTYSTELTIEIKTGDWDWHRI